MKTSRRRLLRAAVAAPAALVVARPLRFFEGDAGAMAADGLRVPASGLRLDGRDLVGHSLSWADTDTTAAADVRTRLETGWTPWSEVQADRGHGPDEPGRDHGPPVLVPGALAYEIATRPGTVDLRVHPLSADSPAPTGFSSPTTVSPLPGLDIIERHNWTDRPRLRSWDCGIRSSLYGATCRSDVGIRHALVHHTVTENDYASSTVPDLLIGIQRYHMDTRGWDDIAYNFVIDRWGRIWQAREGELYEPITGGHTTGLNAESVGVAVLGEFGTHSPAQEVIDSLSLLLGWKLSLHGVDPLGTNVVRSTGGDYDEPGDLVEVFNIAGHRDHQITGCPGNALYSRVAEIRNAAAELVPVYGYLGPRYAPDEVLLEGWVVERFSPTEPVAVEITVDGVTTDLVADQDVSGLRIEEFDLTRYEAENPGAGRNHGIQRTVPIDLDTRSITVIANASDGRSASLMDLVLFATFVDVEPDLWYSDAIYWLRETGLTEGTFPGLFEPKDRLTRAQMATFLWRFMDRPAVTVAHPFIDVAAGEWYHDPVAWLHQEGITTGTSPDTFSPEDFITRGQMATFLWRLCGRIQPDDPPSFSDVPAGAYYETPVAWLHETGITTGVSATAFAPDRTVIRGEMAVFLRRLATTPEAWVETEPSSFVMI